MGSGCWLFRHRSPSAEHHVHVDSGAMRETPLPEFAWCKRYQQGFMGLLFFGLKHFPWFRLREVQCVGTRVLCALAVMTMNGQSTRLKKKPGRGVVA